jgi:hypothetical protein
MDAQPKLDDAHEKLEKALDEACDEDLTKDVKRADTDEIIRIEEALDEAHRAAKVVVSERLLRRAKNEAPESHRVFEDASHKRWHAFAVQPSTGTKERKALPERYRSGWLAFESDDEMRRVAPIPEDWTTVSVEALRELCANAEVAPKRINAIDTSALLRKFKP